MLPTYQNAAFSHRVFELVTLNDLVFLQNFESVVFAGIFFLHKENLSVTTLSNHSHRLKVLYVYLPGLLLLGGDNVIIFFDDGVGLLSELGVLFLTEWSISIYYFINEVPVFYYQQRNQPDNLRHGVRGQTTGKKVETPQSLHFGKYE
jgi:hypothetical protein